jgi:hypothetical protein
MSLRLSGMAAAAALLALGFTVASAQPEQGPPPQETAPPADIPVAPAAPPAPQSAPTPAPAPTTQLPPEETAPAPAETAKDDSLPSSSAAPARPAVQQRRTLYTAAVIQVLDKVTADSLRFEAPLHQLIRYKGLLFYVNTCQSGVQDQPTAVAHLEIDSQPPSLPGRPPNPVKMVFRGWMYADTPGPHAFEHPVYDAWLIACKTASPGA